jgi:hypothetical protein
MKKLKKTTKISKKASRWVSRAECDKLRHLQQDHCRFLTKLIENNAIDSEAKKLLKGIRKDVISSVTKSTRIFMPY